MTEYWKSTPKFWCKHCKTFVRDTPLEKNNHEATAKHQGNLKRFLRDLHRTNEASERDKQRAKDEVARLNGTKTNSVSRFDTTGKTTIVSTSTLRNATPDERKRQMAQLAEMGVSVPEEFRKENAMAGDWEVVSRQVVGTGPKIGNQQQDGEDQKGSVNIGVRKRKVEDEDDEGQQEAERKRPNWGSDMKSLPGDEEDLDALLEAKTTVIPNPTIKKEESDVKEEATTEAAMHTPDAPLPATAAVTKDNEANDIGSLFKKRKPKSKI